ncbi:MAG TPA: type IV secretory system conjugative DNA transfer family protein [Bryobacteraceae bacterium]|jgi:type IV secretion system protein VirD4
MEQHLPIPYGYNPLRKTFPSYVGDRHLCTFGPARSGKGATLIAQALMRAVHSAVVIDPKGQNAAVTARARRAMGQDVFALNPFGLHTGAPWHLPRNRFNPLSQLDLSDANVAAKGRAIAQAMIVTEGRDPYFDETGRDFTMMTNLHVVETHGKDGTLAHTRKIITDIASRSAEGARHLIRMSKSPYPFISQPAGRFRDPEARDIASAINTAVTQTAFLDDPALTHPRTGTLTGSDIDLAQLKRKPMTYYVILPGELLQSYGSFLRLLITACINQVISAPGGYPVLMILDEFARLENLPVVTSAFSFAAGYNFQLWPFLQDLAQLQHVYGKEWSSILSACGMTQFFTPVDMETAEYIQRRGGTMTGETRSRNYTGTLIKRPQGESRSEARIPLLPIERVMSMAPDESLVFFAGRHEPLLAGRRPYWTIPRLAGLYDPDPFHMP